MSAIYAQSDNKVPNYFCYSQICCTVNNRSVAPNSGLYKIVIPTEAKWRDLLFSPIH